MAEEKILSKEKVLSINLRKKAIKSTRWSRTKSYIKALREQLKNELKVDKIKIDKKLNDKIWERGIEKPKLKLRLKAIKLDDGSIRVELME